MRRHVMMDYPDQVFGEINSIVVPGRRMMILIWEMIIKVDLLHVASGIILIRESEKQTCSWKTSIEQRVMSLRKLACMQKPVSCVLSITLNWSDVLVELLYWIIPLMLMITQH